MWPPTVLLSLSKIFKLKPKKPMWDVWKSPKGSFWLEMKQRQNKLEVGYERQRKHGLATQRVQKSRQDKFTMIWIIYSKDQDPESDPQEDSFSWMQYLYDFDIDDIKQAISQVITNPESLASSWAQSSITGRFILGATPSRVKATLDNEFPSVVRV